jgi:hypothetical protein
MLRRNMVTGAVMASEVDTWAEPAKVYPAPDAEGRWIVEAPDLAHESDGQTAPLFSDHGTATMALRYAYERYGRARFFAF